MTAYLVRCPCGRPHRIDSEPVDFYGDVFDSFECADRECARTVACLRSAVEPTRGFVVGWCHVDLVGAMRDVVIDGGRMGRLRLVA